MALFFSSTTAISQVGYFKYKIHQSNTPIRSLILSNFISFMVGLSLGCVCVIVLSWGNFLKGDQMEVLVHVTSAPPDRAFFSQIKSVKFQNGWKKDYSLNEIPGCPDRPLHLLILVLSAPNLSKRRNAIRQTWMHAYKSRNVLATTRFLVGLLNLSEERLSLLKKEQDDNGDLLLLEDLNDSYKNLSAKVLLGLKWTLEENKKFDYVIKTDDDSFVRIEGISDALRQMGCHEDIYWGYFIGNAWPRDRGKWKEHEWLMCPHYLPYAVGGGYVLSQKVVKMMMKFSDRLVLYHNEDTTVSSWLTPYRLLRKHDVRFNVESQSHGCNNKYLITHKEMVKSLYSKYSNLVKNGALCLQEKTVRRAYIYNWTATPPNCCKRVN